MSDRNKRYYERHRDRILRNRKSKRIKKTAELQTTASIFRRMLQLVPQLSNQTEKALLALLVLSCTVFLISESTHTMQVMEGEGALPKAVFCEVLLVGISMVSVSTRSLRVLRVLCLLGISILAMMNTLGAPLNSFSQARRGVLATSAEIASLEQSIASKQILLNRYLETDRISGARRIESELSGLTSKLSEVKRVAVSQKSETILMLGFGHHGGECHFC